MKSVMWMVAALAACVVSRTNADGVCYDPDHTTKSESTVRADMATIKGKGFSHVRTYISKFGNTDMASIVASSGLRVSLGVPYPQSGYSDQITAARNAAVNSGAVDFIFVGNENLAGQGSVPQSMFDAIAEVRKGLPSGTKVGTVQRTAEFVSPPSRMAELVAACDFVGVNIHPFFTGGLTGDTAITQTAAQWNAVLKSGLPSISDKLVLTETGWPTDGSYAGNTGSLSGANAYFQAYKSWSSFLPDSKKYYFQFFDTPYKSETYEKYFGLFGSDSSTKVTASGSSSSTPAPTTPAPTTPSPTTPAPTTPAPTTPAPTTVSPSLNATSSVAGSGSEDLDDLTSSASGSAEVEVAGEASTTGSSENAESNAENEAGVADLTATGTTKGSTKETTETTGTEETGGNNESTVEANTQSASSGSSVLGVVVVAAFGCAAVAAAFAFIYKARQKANELEASENKSFDSFSMTPGGGCAL